MHHFVAIGEFKLDEVADKDRRLGEVDVNFIEEITVSHARRE